MNIVPAVAITVFKDEDVLLVKHGEKAGHITGVFGLPAGRNEEGESNLAAAIRELEEETGLTAREEDMIEYPQNTYTADLARKDGRTIRSTMTVLICHQYEGELRGTEETVPEWVNVTEIEQYKLLPNVKEAVNDSLSYLKEKGY